MNTIALRVRMVAAIGAAALLGGGCEGPDDGLAAAVEPDFAELGGSSLERVSPTMQHGMVGEIAPYPVTVRVVDVEGVAAEGVIVRFDVFQGGGEALPRYDTTDASGYASVRWRLGPEPGTNYLRAVIPGVVATRFAAQGRMPAAMVDVEVSPGTVLLESIGATQAMSGYGFDQNGNLVGARFDWRSADPSIASVDSMGVVTAVDNGSTLIIGRAPNAMEDTAEITVAQRVANVSVTPALDTIRLAETTQLTPHPTDRNGHPIEAYSAVWSSGSPNIASVSSTGLVTGNSVGTTNVTVTIDGRAVSATIVVNTSAPPPPTGNVVFHSDWSTAQGGTIDAILDRGQALPWDLKVGNGDLNRVVPAAGLGFPADMANVYLNVAEYSGNTSQLVYTDQVRLHHTYGHLPIPGVGESLFYRWYMRYVVPDAIDPTGGVPHTVQDGPAAGSQNWMWETPINRDGTWAPQFAFSAANGYPNNRFRAAPLLKNHTYRIELQILRTSTTTFQAHARIYDQNGTLVRDDDDFRNGAGSGPNTLADGVQLNFDDVAYLAGWQIGNNGPSWRNVTAAQFPFNLWYFGGSAVCVDDWCGAYSPTEGD